jgi:hypothetical protein
MEGNLITQDTVVSEWMDLQPTFMREDIIRSSFAKTGLHPLNPAVFSKEDFQPSYTFSVWSHLPAGYPYAASVDTAVDASESGEESEDIEPVSARPCIFLKTNKLTFYSSTDQHRATTIGRLWSTRGTNHHPITTSTIYRPTYRFPP